MDRRVWDEKATDKSPKVDRIQHDLAVPASQDTIRQISYWTKALASFMLLLSLFLRGNKTDALPRSAKAEFKSRRLRRAIYGLTIVTAATCSSAVMSRYSTKRSPDEYQVNTESLIIPQRSSSDSFGGCNKRLGSIWFSSCPKLAFRAAASFLVGFLQLR
jgi:hypothetical protein